jgi:oligopeptidase B
LKITGRIEDKTNKEALPYANIRTSDSGHGCVSNTDGEFRLFVPTNYKDSLIIVSFVGYQSDTMIIQKDKKEIYLFSLEPITTQLNEVSVSFPDPYDIITQFFMNASSNYWQKPISTDAFYREILFENEKATKMTESACVFYLTPYSTSFERSDATSNLFEGESYSDYDTRSYLIEVPQLRHPSNKVKLQAVRTSNDLSTENDFYIMGGPLGLLSYDFINFKPNWIIKSDNKDYDKIYKAIRKYFTIAKISYTTYDQKPALMIKTSRGTTQEWTFLIDRSTMAIIRYQIIFRLGSEYTRVSTGKQFINRKAPKETITTDSTIIDISYKNNGQTWDYSLVAAKSYFTFKPNKERSIKIRTEREMMFNKVTSRDAIAFESSTCFSNNTFTNLFNYPIDYDSTFWQDYNSLIPTKLQQQIIKDLEISAPLEQQYKNKFVFDSTLNIPQAKKICDTLIFGCDTIIDFYNWMYDNQFNQSKNYAEAENRYYENYMLSINKTSRAFYNELAVTYFNNRFDLSKNERKESDCFYFDKDYGINGALVKQKKEIYSQSDILIDLNIEKKNNPQLEVAGYGFNPDTTVFYYTVLPYGEDAYFDLVTYFRDLKSMQIIDTLETFIADWLNSDTYFFYGNNEGDYFFNKIYYRSIKDRKTKLLFESGNNERLLINLSESRKYCFIYTIDGTNASKLFISDNFRNPSTFIPFGNSCNSCSQSANHFKNDDNIYISHNNNSPNFQLSVTDLAYPDYDSCKTIIPENSETELVSFNKAGDLFVLQTRRDINKNISIYNPNTDVTKEIDFPDDYYNASAKRIKENEFVIKYQTYTRPTEYFRYYIDKDSLISIGKDSVNNFSKTDIVAEVKYTNAEDGTVLPIVLIYNKKTKFKKSPMLIKTYGGGGSVYLPSFDEDILPLINRGVIVAYALVRGGGETGFENILKSSGQGSLDNLEDFATCVRYLIDNKYTANDRLFAYGKSHGGFVVSYSLVNYPELFKGVILDVPECDILNSLQDSTTVDASLQYAYYGNPYNPNEFKLIMKTDSYLNIRNRNYPNTLIYGAWQDINVNPSKSLKFVAKLREYNTGNNIILYRMFMSAGHSLSDDLNKRKWSEIYSFILNSMETK